MGRLDNKVAIVTGGGSGIGKATAILFAKEGAKVVVADVLVDGGEDTVRTIKETGGEAIFVKTDVAQASKVAAMVRVAVDTFGKLNILYNCAGIMVRKFVPLHEIEESDFDRVIAVNLKGVFLGMKYAVPEMLKVGGGSIINQGSVGAVRAVPKVSPYCASKGGIAGISRAAGTDYLRNNIRVNWIEPGLIPTPMVTRDILGGDKEAYQKMLSEQPMGRFGTEEEIANLVLFLASDESSYVTATGIKIDGGLSQGAPMT